MPDSMLNELLEFDAAPKKVRRAFLSEQAEKHLLRPGQRLYKFTEFPLVDAQGRITPWWSSVEPIMPGDCGLAGTCERAQRLEVDVRDFARARSSVTRQWNEMSHYLQVRTLVPLYGFFGRCSGQRYDEENPELPNVYFIGGAYQWWIPNLTRAHVVAIK